MALINCPECNKEISDMSLTCINCGYPIKEFVKRQSEEHQEKMETTRRNSIEQRYSDARNSAVMKELSSKEYQYKVKVEKTPYKVDILFTIGFILLGLSILYLLMERERSLFFIICCSIGIIIGGISLYMSQIYRKQHNKKKEILNSEYKRHVNGLPDDIKVAIQQKKILDATIEQEKSTKPKAKYTPKCPTCQSPDIKQISSTRRWLGTGLFGIGSTDMGKTMVCKNCSYKW